MGWRELCKDRICVAQRIQMSLITTIAMDVTYLEFVLPQRCCSWLDPKWLTMLPGLNESRCGSKSKWQRCCKVRKIEEGKWRCLGDARLNLVDSNCGAKHCPVRVGGVVGYSGTGKCGIHMPRGVTLKALALLAGRPPSVKLAHISHNGCWHPLSSGIARHSRSTRSTVPYLRATSS